MRAITTLKDTPQMAAAGCFRAIRTPPSMRRMGLPEWCAFSGGKIHISVVGLRPISEWGTGPQGQDK